MYNIYYLTTTVHGCLSLVAVISHLNLTVDCVRYKLHNIVYVYSS